MRIVLEGSDARWYLAYLALSFPCWLYSCHKVGDWLSAKTIKWVDRPKKPARYVGQYDPCE